MYNPGQELSSINFGAMIGGPLTAVVNAQAQSAMTTVDFIRDVGFEKETITENDTTREVIGKPIYVSFKYDKEIKPYEPAQDGKEAVPAEFKTMSMEVPILTMLPIPFIKIENADIEFNAKINSVSSNTTSTDTNASANLTASASYRGIAYRASATLNASFSHQKKTTSSEDVKKEFSLNIKVHAVQDDMPAGMSKLLDILERSIINKESSNSETASESEE